eukprot:8627436-Ditylum_brightwellii.AAC.1
MVMKNCHQLTRTKFNSPPHKKTVQKSTTSKQVISRKPCPPSLKQQQATQSSPHLEQSCNTISPYHTSALHFADASVCPSTVSHIDAVARNIGWTSSAATTLTVCATQSCGCTTSAVTSISTGCAA